MIRNTFSRRSMRYDLKVLLDKAEQRVPLSGPQMQSILRLREPDEIEEVFQVARRLRERHFGNRVFLYGFLYFSTYCVNHCRFCLYRKNNRAAVRYRKSPDGIIESAERLADSGVHLIDLTMGEDPAILQAGGPGIERLAETVRSVKQRTHLPIMLSAGVLPETVLSEVSQAGVDWYACYQETHNRTLYTRLRTGQDYDLRLDSKRTAKEHDLLIEEGVMVGVGESTVDIAESIIAMRGLRADQVRVMSFVPQKGTPMEHCARPSSLRELLVIALMRLVFPDCLIPASLDVGGHGALGRKLAAGANVVTSLIPPGQGLAGVAQCDSEIEDGKRTVAGIQDILSDSGLQPASVDEYRSWMSQRRQFSMPVMSR